MALAWDIKEKLCYVALDHDAELSAASTTSAVDKEYTLPDGATITVGSERFRAPEVLFDPSLMGQESRGIHHLVHDTINKCDIDVRRELYNNIVLSGGTSMFEGMQTSCDALGVSVVERASVVRVLSFAVGARERQMSVAPCFAGAISASGWGAEHGVEFYLDRSRCNGLLEAAVQRGHHAWWLCRESARGCTPRTQVPGVDRWLYPVISVHIPKHVDYEVGALRKRL
eukprot:1154607-Pelagomonas_calceolata.AAC.2